MRGEHYNDAPLGELHQRLLGPAQERVELQASTERPEMHRQERGQRNAGDTVDERHDFHANTVSTARAPIHASSTPNATTNHSRERPRQPSHSVSTGRRPIGACTAIASTNTI